MLKFYVRYRSMSLLLLSVFDGAQTKLPRSYSVPAMWILVETLVVAPRAVLQDAASPEIVSSWPWVAMATILVLLSVIALATRRRLPFGK
jgi:hypothetical protein